MQSTQEGESKVYALSLLHHMCQANARHALVFYVNYQKMTVLTMRLQRKKAPGALPVLSSREISRPSTAPLLGQLVHLTASLEHDEQDGCP